LAASSPPEHEFKDGKSGSAQSHKCKKDAHGPGHQSFTRNVQNPLAGGGFGPFLFAFVFQTHVLVPVLAGRHGSGSPTLIPRRLEEEEEEDEDDVADKDEDGVADVATAEGWGDDDCLLLLRM